MIIGKRNHPEILLLAAFLVLAAPIAARADSLFRLFPEIGVAGVYSDNIPLRTTNPIGDFAFTGIAGFYLDYTSSARYASLHYDTFGQIFAHQSRFDRAGEGQYVSASDLENISPTTKLRVDELFYRDAPTVSSVIVSDQAPSFNTVANQLLLANNQLSVNWFTAYLTHSWSHNWSSELTVHQGTYWSGSGGSNGGGSSSYEQSLSTVTSHYFSHHFTVGAGYRFYDFRFSAPGVPGEQAHWPFVRITWLPIENLYLSGIVGVVFARVQGNNTETVNPGGTGLLEYNYKRARLNVYGGQEPEVSTLTNGAAGIARFVRGNILYQFTQRLSGTAGGGFYETTGTRDQAQLVSWGFRLNERVNQWLAVYAGFTQVRRTETVPPQFLPSGTQNGLEATGNYFTVGAAASVEALRWSF
jgi:hypothetical protein